MFPTRRTSMRSSSVILAVLTSVTFSPARAQSLHALYNFDVQIGSNGLTMSNGAIVGVTLDVSQSQGAEFYQLVPPAGGSGPWTRTILYQFALKDGRPNSSSLAGAHGEYYGTTSSGGAYNVGEVYQLGPPPRGHCGVSTASAQRNVRLMDVRPLGLQGSTRPVVYTWWLRPPGRSSDWCPRHHQAAHGIRRSWSL